MKRLSYLSCGLPLLITLLISTGLTACSGESLSSLKSEPGGPKILAMKTEPATIELNRDLKPRLNDIPKVVVNVQDPHSRVTDVMLHFKNVPITIPMENRGGTVWEANFNSQQLEMMAVSGQTVKYGAEVIAKNSDGKITTSQNPVEVAVKAPNLALPAHI